MAITINLMRYDYSPLRALFAVAPGLRRADGRVLSLYLPASPEGYDDRLYDIEFGDLRQRYRDRLDAKDLVVLESELPRLRALLRVVRPAGIPAIAGFAQAQPDLLELLPLPVTTVERLEVGDPLLAPALRQLELVPPVLVAVVDKEEARIFGFILSRLFEIVDLTGARVRHSRAGGTSAPSNQRKAENRARANLERVAREIHRELDRGAYAGLFLAGPQEARAELERILSRSGRTPVAGRIGASLDSATLEADLRRELLGLEVGVGPESAPH